ncbi:hypothetical protein K1719_044768 [Acacia pycnantha]|nr:hypothetical protein K1719_044768 [Acacia pycnantha]
MGTMGKIHHINVVRLLGFVFDGCHRALVYDFFPNGSLQKFISSPDNKESFMGWSKLQQIALAIARGIEYLHQGLWCIQWHSINRPSMKTLIQMLEGEVDKLKVPLNPFGFTASTNSSITVPTKHLNLGLDVIHELE